jgi:cell division septal protein FtsQ
MFSIIQSIKEVISFVGVLIYVVFFSEFLEINSIDIGGNEIISNDSILERINPEISGEYLGFIRKNNLLLIRTNKIKTNVLNDFKIIREIKIKRRFPDGLKISVIERHPQLVFCGAGQCFLIDEKREAYDNFNGENDNNFIILTDESCKGINLGDLIAEPNYIEYIKGIREGLTGLGLEVENDFRTVSFISKDIRVKTKEGWEIYFNEDVPLEKEISMLKIVLDNKITEEQRKDLEYIDLRIDNKIFYKFRDGTPSQIAKEKADAASGESVTPVTTNASDKKD